MIYDKVILGAGLYGLYSALFCAKRDKNQKILVLEYDDVPFKRATYINQARVHMGYHYPRSLSTAIKSAKYFERFNEDFSFCINQKFSKIYATSQQFSWTNSEQFQKFCQASQIKCQEISSTKYFREGMCDGAFLTEEFTYDAQILKDFFLKEISNYPNITLQFSTKVNEIRKQTDAFEISLQNNQNIITPFILNATYASVNQILHKLDFESFKIKYELCEIILCTVGDNLKDVGITLMDGPFFSIMPFGKTGLHSLTSVTFTPHKTSYDEYPTFTCQLKSDGYCSTKQLGNCNDCSAKPATAWSYMSNIARKYLKEDFAFDYHSSLFSMKPILLASEIDDSRPTVIKQFSTNPTFISVLSGKINTVYDLDEVLQHDCH